MSTGFDWSMVWSIGVGVGSLLAGIGIFVGMLALAKTLSRVNVTLSGVDDQVAGLGKPVGDMLTHVGGISDTADKTLARLSGVATSLEGVAGSFAQTAELAKNAVSPAIVNMGATISGVSAGLRRLVTGRNHSEES